MSGPWNLWVAQLTGFREEALSLYFFGGAEARVANKDSGEVIQTHPQPPSPPPPALSVGSLRLQACSASDHLDGWHSLWQLDRDARVLREVATSSDSTATEYCLGSQVAVAEAALLFAKLNATGAALAPNMVARSLSVMSCSDQRALQWSWDAGTVNSGHRQKSAEVKFDGIDLLLARTVMPPVVMQIESVTAPGFCLAYYGAEENTRFKMLSLQNCSATLDPARPTNAPWSSRWVVDTLPSLTAKMIPIPRPVVMLRLTHHRATDGQSWCLTAVAGSYSDISYMSGNFHNMLDIAVCNTSRPAQQWYWDRGAVGSALIETAMTHEQRILVGWEVCETQPPPTCSCQQAPQDMLVVPEYCGRWSTAADDRMLRIYCYTNTTCPERVNYTQGSSRFIVSCLSKPKAKCCIQSGSGSGATLRGGSCDLAHSWRAKLVTPTAAEKTDTGAPPAEAAAAVAADVFQLSATSDRESCLARYLPALLPGTPRPPAGCKCLAFDAAVPGTQFWVTTKAHCGVWSTYDGVHHHGWCYTDPRAKCLPKWSQPLPHDDYTFVGRLPGMVDCVIDGNPTYAQRDNQPTLGRSNIDTIGTPHTQIVLKQDVCTAPSYGEGRILSSSLRRLDMDMDSAGGTASWTELGNRSSSQIYWPRAVAGASSWSVRCAPLLRHSTVGFEQPGHSCAAGMVFSGDFDFCASVDWYRNASVKEGVWAGLGKGSTAPRFEIDSTNRWNPESSLNGDQEAAQSGGRETDVWLPPDTLKLHNSSGWYVLAGVSRWIRVTSLDAAAIFDAGYTTYSYSSANGGKTFSWPLGRAHAQCWNGYIVDGSALMFGGQLRVLFGLKNFPRAAAEFTPQQNRRFLLNDFWILHADADDIASDTTSVLQMRSSLATRIAGSSSLIDQPMYLPVPPRKVGGQFAMTAYPGPRMGGGTWMSDAKFTLPGHNIRRDQASQLAQDAWLFGGIGKRISNPVSTQGQAQTVEEFVGGSDWVTNLCDLWLFAIRVGWVLVQTCERDRVVLSAAHIMPLLPPQHQQGSGKGPVVPAAGIMSSTWSDDTESLWMYGGVTKCDQHAPLTRYQQQQQQQAADKTHLNVTVCDVSWPDYGSSGDYYYSVDIDTFDAGCSGELWRFANSAWARVEPPPGAISAGAWPTGSKCGAVAALHGFGAVMPSLSSKVESDVILVGGWSGALGGGQCANDNMTCSTESSQYWRATDPGGSQANDRRY